MLPCVAQGADELLAAHPEGVGQGRLQRVRRGTASLQLLAVLRVAAGHAVDPLVDADEALVHMAIGDRHQDGRPAARKALWIEEAAHRVRCDRARQLAVAQLGQPPCSDQAMRLPAAAGRRLVDVVQQGGDLDELRVKLVARGRKEARRLGGDACHAT